MAGPGGDVRTMSPQETAQWCNSLALCGVKGRILRDLQEQIQRRHIDGLQFDQMLRTNTLTDLGIEDLNARLALSIRRSWTTDFNGVTFVNYAASQAHFQGRDEDPRRHKRDFFSQANGPDEHSRASYGGMPPSRGRDMPWSPSMAHGVPPLRDPQGGMERVGRDPRLEDPYSVVDQRVPPPYAGDRGMGFDDFYDRGMGPMPADRRAAWRGGPPRLEGLDPWGRGPQIQIPPSPPGGRDPYGYDPGYDPGYPDDLYDRVPGHPRDDPGRSLGYPDRGPAYSPEDERHERAMRRSPGGEAWSGMGLDQALPKRGPVPNNVARMYDGPPGPAKAQPRSPPGSRAYEEHDYEPPQPAVPSKGGRASVRDPNAGEWGGHFGFGEEPAPPPKRPQRREAREPEEAPGPSPGAWRGDVFDEGAKVPPMPRPGRASRPVGHSPERAEGFHDMIDMDVCDADDRDMEEEPERFKEPPPAATRPVPRARRQTPPADDGWGGQSLGDALAPKQATPSGGSTTTGAGGSSSSSVRSGGQKSTPSGAGSADPGKSPEWIMNWVRSLPESHVPEKTREHLADLIAEAQMNGRSFSDYVHKVPPEVCAPKHAMKLKAAWSNVLKEAEVAEMAAACAVRPAQKAMMIVV